MKLHDITHIRRNNMSLLFLRTKTDLLHTMATQTTQQAAQLLLP